MATSAAPASLGRRAHAVAAAGLADRLLRELEALEATGATWITSSTICNGLTTCGGSRVDHRRWLLVNMSGTTTALLIAGFVFEGEKAEALGAARALANDDEAGDLRPSFRPSARQVAGAVTPSAASCSRRWRSSAGRSACRCLVVGERALDQRHFRKGVGGWDSCSCSSPHCRGEGGGEGRRATLRQRTRWGRPRLPERFAPCDAKEAKCRRAREFAARRRVKWRGRLRR